MENTMRSAVIISGLPPCFRQVVSGLRNPFSHNYFDELREIYMIN